MAPQIIAHRGASRERSANTLPAFVRALELGADAIELDVHGTRDGALVVHPDATLGADGARPIATLTLSAIRGLEPDPNYKSYVPTLSGVFDLVAGRAVVYVEVKAQGITEAVVDLIRREGADAAVHAFDHQIGRAARGRWAALPTGILSASYVLDVGEALRAAGAREMPSWTRWTRWTLPAAA